jgi:hypothetical protein
VEYIERQTPFGYTIFCDDIRLEMGGQFSFVGVYPHEMQVHVDLPVAIPKLSLAVHFFCRADQLDEPVQVRIMEPGASIDAPTHSFDLPIDHIRNTAQAPDAGAEEPMVGGMFPVMFAPFRIEKEGRLNVRAVRAGKAIRLGSLLIRRAPQFIAGPSDAVPGETGDIGETTNKS